MRHLMGTHLGHLCVFTLCRLMQTEAMHTDHAAAANNNNNHAAIRGAVFFIGMALWGSQRVSSLSHTPVAVLPSFLQALSKSRT